MADALRFRVAASQRPYAATMDAARFDELANIEALPPIARPGRVAPLVRLTRRVFQVLLRPWLATQTIFNRELARQLDHGRLITTDLDRRMPHLERSLQRLEARIQQLEAVRSAGPPAVARANRLDLATMLAMFVTGRVRHPPARVLLLDAAPALNSELRDAGYTVCSVGEERGAAPAGIRHCRGTVAALPFRDASLDVVIGTLRIPPLGAEGGSAPDPPLADVVRVLKPDGRFLGVVQAGEPCPGRDILGSIVRPLQLTETLHTRFESAADGTTTILTLLHAGRADVSGR
jgi:hypothetical protein